MILKKLTPFTRYKKFFNRKNHFWGTIYFQGEKLYICDIFLILLTQCEKARFFTATVGRGFCLLWWQRPYVMRGLKGRTIVRWQGYFGSLLSAYTRPDTLFSGFFPAEILCGPFGAAHLTFILNFRKNFFIFIINI